MSGIFQLLLDDQEKETGQDVMDIIDADDDDVNDDHGMASQIEEIVSGDDDDKDHRDTGEKKAQTSRQAPNTSSADHVISGKVIGELVFIPLR